GDGSSSTARCWRPSAPRTTSISSTRTCFLSPRQKRPTSDLTSSQRYESSTEDGGCSGDENYLHFVDHQRSCNRVKWLKMRANLQCVATGHGDKWEAICLDLDLAVQGHSFEEVRQSLGVAIEMYVERAMEAPEPTRSQLLNRKAPFFVRLIWALRLFR